VDQRRANFVKKEGHGTVKITEEGDHPARAEQKNYMLTFWGGTFRMMYVLFALARVLFGKKRIVSYLACGHCRNSQMWVMKSVCSSCVRLKNRLIVLAHSFFS